MSMYDDRIRGVAVWSFCGFALLGCRHQLQAPPLPPAMQTPGVFQLAPRLPPPPSMHATLPRILFEEHPVATSEVKTRRRIHKMPQGAVSVPVVETPAADDAPTAPTVDATLGVLSPGGDSTAAQGQAADAIDAVQRRLDTLIHDAHGTKPRGLSQVRQFLNQAKSALGMGDIEGAKNLATKAGLLLDDVQQ